MRLWANNPPMNHKRRISIGSPRSRAINLVVVKIPFLMMLLTSTQEAVNQPIFCVADFRPNPLFDESLMVWVDG